MKPIRILKLAAPVALVLLLAGCITDGYQYRGGYGGDYYYGQPSVEYRHHGYYGYGYPYYGRSGWSFGMRYGYPYYGSFYGGYGGYGGYGYGWPYYYRGWPGHPPIIVYPGPDPDPGTGGGGGGDQGAPPWRDLDRLRDVGGVRPPIDSEPRMPRVDRPTQPPRVSPPRVERPRVQRPSTPPRPRADSGGSRMERVQRAMEDRER